MTKLADTLNHLNKIAQVDENTAFAQREKISLAHIDVQGDLRRNRERLARNTRKAAAKTSAAAAEFSIGQSVRTKLNDRMTGQPMVGVVTKIDGGAVTLDNGRAFTATALIAA